MKKIAGGTGRPVQGTASTGVAPLQSDVTALLFSGAIPVNSVMAVH